MKAKQARSDERLSCRILNLQMSRLPGLEFGVTKSVKFSFCLVLTLAVAFLHYACEFLASSFDTIDIVVGEVPPLALDLTFQLLPFSFRYVFVHVAPPIELTTRRQIC